MSQAAFYVVGREYLSNKHSKKLSVYLGISRIILHVSQKSYARAAVVIPYPQRRDIEIGQTTSIYSINSYDNRQAVNITAPHVALLLCLSTYTKCIEARFSETYSVANRLNTQKVHIYAQKVIQ